MAYDPSLLSEQLKKREVVPTGWPWQLFTLGIIAFIMTIVIYFGIKIGYTPYLNSKITVEEKKISDFAKSVSDSQKKELIGFYSQFVNAQSILDAHRISSKFFDNLESNTHQSVYFTDLNLSTVEKTVRISGIAPDFDVLSNQLDLFKKIPGVVKVSIDNAQARAGAGISFSVLIVFNSEMFKI